MLYLVSKQPTLAATAMLEAGALDRQFPFALVSLNLTCIVLEVVVCYVNLFRCKVMV